MSKELKTSANTVAKKKGIYDLSVLSQNERINLLREIFNDVGDTNNDLYLRLLVFVNPVFTLKELNYFIELLQKRFDYCNVRIAEDRTFTGYYPDVLNLCESSLSKLSSLIAPQSEQEQSDVTDTEPQEQEEEPQEQEREEPNTKDFLINYLVTVYYVDGHSSFRSFSGCADGIVFNFQQNSLHLDDLENGNRSVFNMFNFPDSEEIVACDVSFTLIPDLPF